jgi:acyl transferase domain-containing protein/acyl carrier protein
VKPTAIVGIGCRVPGANGPERLWELLEAGVDAVREVPADRWDVDALYDADPAAPGKMNTRWGGFLEGIDRFDAEFFGIAPREAARMDPQQRLILEVAWEALADGGIAASGLAGSRTGVFVGVSTYDHGAVLASAPGVRETYDGTGSALSIVANRISYLLDLHGPSLAVDTACSSSLVAMHLACRAIEAGEADLALVGGTNIITSPAIGIGFSKGGLMAPDGRCKPFDHRANGYVRSEGIGVVVLKPLEGAVQDGDRIYATVLGSAVNQDGRSNGLVAPNRLAQEEVLRDAYRAAGVDPADVDYVEAHGTGTAVGDPIEVAALASVLGGARPAERPLHLGSLKSNLGHLEAAAGVAGLIKTALSLHRRRLVPTVHYERSNPMLGLDRLPIVVQTRSEPWPGEAARGVAGVSSFGFGGSNAHVVLATAPVPPAPQPQEEVLRLGSEPREEVLRPQLVPVSARSETALRNRALAWAEAAQAEPTDRAWLRATAAAATLRSDHHVHRAAVVACDGEELAAGMRAVAHGDQAPNVAGLRAAARRPPRVVLVFAGQGSQWAGMGRRLATSVPAFREAMSRCDAALAQWLGHPLWDPEVGFVGEGIASIQPSLFAIQIALAETWRAWGVTPSAVVGQSLGEIAAACVCGALSLADAARVVCERSRLLAEIAGSGGLVLVELNYEEACELIRGREHELSIAAVNGPRSTVLSGTLDALGEVLTMLGDRGVFARRIAAEVAGHSPQVEPLLPRLRAALDGLAPRETAVAFYSTVTGERVGGSELGPGYWERNLRAPALLPPAIERLAADGHQTFVEVAPHPVLGRSIAQVVEGSGHKATVVATLRGEEDEQANMLRGLGELYTAGVRVSWPALHPQGSRHLPLPSHEWQHRQFPVGAAILPEDPSTAMVSRRLRRRQGSLLSERIPVTTEPGLRLWRLGVDLNSAPEIAEHRLDGVSLVPAAYWLTAAAEAARSVLGDAPLILEHVAFTRPCLAAEDGDVQLMLRTAFQSDYMTVTVASSGVDGHPVTHADGVVRAARASDSPPRPPLAELIARCTHEIAAVDEYARLERLGLEYGPRFRALADLRAGDREALAQVRMPEGLTPVGLPLHPALLDGCLHAVGAATGELAAGMGWPLPAGAERVWVRHDRVALRMAWCHARVVEAAGRDLRADVLVLDESGSPVWAASGLRIRLIGRRRSPQDGGLYALHWERVTDEPTVEPAGSWLILAGDVATGRELARRLEARGERCRVVVPGTPEAANEQSLSGEDGEAHDRLVADAAAAEPSSLRGVVDLRSTECAPGCADEDVLYSSSTRTLLLAQSLARFPWAGEPPRLWLLTSTTQALSSPGVTTTLAGAPLWGLGRVFSGELPEPACSLIDLPCPIGSADLDALVGALCNAGLPRQSALREGRMHAPTLVPLPASSAASGPRLRPDRTYLLTGGLGSLGLIVARWFVDRGARHIMLIGRSLPSPGAEHALAALREGGAEVTVRHADVGDIACLQGALDGLGTRQPELAGVVHAAGVLEDALVSNLDVETLHRALRGKALGAWNLHRLTRKHPLELFVLFSSLAGIVGSAGQAGYAAANSFLDGLALHRAALGLPALSIAWGPWAGSMPAAKSGVLKRLASRGAPPLLPAVALELLDEALSSGRTNIVAAAFDWRQWHKSGGSAAERLLLARLAGDAAETVDVARRGRLRNTVTACHGASARRRALRRALVGEIADVLHVTPGRVDLTLPFQELGVDSLTAIELRDRLDMGFDLRLSASIMWAHPTVEALAEELLDRIERGEQRPLGVSSRVQTEAANGGQAAAAAGGDLAEIVDDRLVPAAEELWVRGGGSEG